MRNPSPPDGWDGCGGRRKKRDYAQDALYGEGTSKAALSVIKLPSQFYFRKCRPVLHANHSTKQVSICARQFWAVSKVFLNLAREATKVRTLHGAPHEVFARKWMAGFCGLTRLKSPQGGSLRAFDMERSGKRSGVESSESAAASWALSFAYSHFWLFCVPGLAVER